MREVPIQEFEYDVVPALACEGYGNYELYYSSSNPQIGIEVLRKGIHSAIDKSAPAEDLGYICRDEGQIKEAIEAFTIALNEDPSNPYAADELEELRQLS